MKRYVVLMNPSEDGEYGTQWHFVDAHSPAAAVEDVMRNTANPVGDRTLVVEIGDLTEKATVVASSVSFEEQPEA